MIIKKDIILQGRIPGNRGAAVGQGWDELKRKTLDGNLYEIRKLMDINRNRELFNSLAADVC